MELEHFKDICTGGRVYLLGNGPSLDDQDCNALDGCTIGINRSWRKRRSLWHCIPPTDAYFEELARGKWGPACDLRPGWRSTAIFTVGRMKAVQDRLNRFTMIGAPRLDARDFFVAIEEDFHPPSTILPGSDFKYTGVFALKLAVYMGFTDIYLLGYDGGLKGHFRTGETSGRFSDRTDKPNWADHNKEHEAVAHRLPAGVKVTNHCLDSQITVWPRVPIEG